MDREAWPAAELNPTEWLNWLKPALQQILKELI